MGEKEKENLEKEKENLEKENLQLKETIKTLQHEKENLEKENFQLKETNTQNSMGEYVVPSVTNDTPEKDVEKVIANEDEPMETEKVTTHPLSNMLVLKFDINILYCILSP